MRTSTLAELDLDASQDLVNSSRLYQWIAKRFQLEELTPGYLDYWRRRTLAVGLSTASLTVFPVALLGTAFGFRNSEPTVSAVHLLMAIGLAVAALAPGLTANSRLWIFMTTVITAPWALVFTTSVPAAGHLTASIGAPIFVALVAGRRPAIAIVATNLTLTAGTGLYLAQNLPSSWPTAEFDSTSWIMTSAASSAVGLALALTIDDLVGRGLGPALNSSRNRADRLLDANQKLESLAEDLGHRREELRSVLWASSHTMVEPVKLINNYALLLADDPTPEERSHYQSTLVNQAQNLHSVVAAFRRYLSIDDCLDDMQPVPIADAIRTLQHSHPTLQLPSEPWMETTTAGLDRDFLLQVIGEPISNALRHNPTPPNISIESHHIDTTWHLEITDDGHGLDQALVANVFDPFRNSAALGSNRSADSRLGTTTDDGIGLAMANKIVRLVRGSITLESHPHQKTAVHIQLPTRIID